jgi:hypothetical protein
VLDLTRNEIAILDQSIDARFDVVDRDAFKAKIESRLGDLMNLKGGFTLAENADGRGDGELCSGIPRRSSQARNAGID